MGAMFLAGLVACTTSTARGYCKKHDLPIPEKVIATIDMDDETELVTNVDFKIIVPENFPEKRFKALVRASGTCTVKAGGRIHPALLEQQVTNKIRSTVIKEKNPDSSAGILLRG